MGNSSSGISGFGSALVQGRRRVPGPAAKMLTGIANVNIRSICPQIGGLAEPYSGFRTSELEPVAPAIVWMQAKKTPGVGAVGAQSPPLPVFR